MGFIHHIERRFN